MEPGMEGPAKELPNNDELLAGAIALASKHLNMAIQDAARAGLRTDITVSEQWIYPRRAPLDEEHPSIAARQVYTTCYRRQEIKSVWMIDDGKPVEDLDCARAIRDREAAEDDGA